MSRVGIAVLAGIVLGTTTPSYAETSVARRTSKASKASSSGEERTANKQRSKKRTAKRKKTAKHASKRKKSRSSRDKSKRRDKRVAIAKNVSRNMPPGWTWPPDEAMKKAGDACKQELDELGVVWKRASREGKMATPVVVPSMEIGGIKYVSAYRRGPHRLDCHFVRTLADIGPALYALGVREIKFGSIYRNTNVRAHGMTKPILSRHALGIAMDIKSFTDDEGRVSVVELDYLRGDPLLHAVEDVINKSGKFRAVLTPGNDPISHYDHFHVEAFVDYRGFR